MTFGVGRFGLYVDRVVHRASQGVIVVLAAFVVFELLGFDPGFGVAIDQRLYFNAAHRWMATGEFYLPRQLAGHYTVAMGDVLYPPTLLWLLVPFSMLPGWIWYAVPVAALCYVVRRLRPAAWAWAILALIAMWPRTLAIFLFGNPSMWIVAFVALGLVWNWPAVFVLLKPTLGPFALIGIRTRTWWAALAVLIVASLPFLSLWIDYGEVIRNSNASLAYSFPDLPLMCAPIVAWLGRTQRKPAFPG